MNKRMSKQDRQGVRTATDIERKYNLGDISKNRDIGSKQDILLQQINQDLSAFKAQTNAKIEELEGNDKMWFYSGTPTLENHPAVDWTTDELKAKHIGDMYYDVDNGDMYLFKSTDGVYAWESCFGSDVDYDTTYNEGYNNGYTDGAASVPNPLEYVKRLQSSFDGAAFPEKYEMTMNIPNILSMQGAFLNSTGIVKLTIKGNVANNQVNFSDAIRISTLEVLDLTEFNAVFGNAQYCFYGNTAMKEIKGIIDFTNATNITNTFELCNALEQVQFKANSINLSIRFAQSSKLSSDTVQSIVDGLATVETAQTLTLHATIKATLTEAQIAQITSKNWILA